MARTPKAPPPPVLARRGRKPKAAEPVELAADTSDGTEETEAVEAEAATVMPVEKPIRGKPGPKPKPRSKSAMTTLSDVDEPQPAMNLDQPHATSEPTLDLFTYFILL